MRNSINQDISVEISTIQDLKKFVNNMYGGLTAKNKLFFNNRNKSQRLELFGNCSKTDFYNKFIVEIDLKEHGFPLNSKLFINRGLRTRLLRALDMVFNYAQSNNYKIISINSMQLRYAKTSNNEKNWVQILPFLE